jgi:hypothetical protein
MNSIVSTDYNNNYAETWSVIMTDYPAAHSMDTYWFAVDADGNVAMFDTGEGGVVPKDALRSVDGLDCLFAEIAKDCEHRSIRIDASSENILTRSKAATNPNDDICCSTDGDNVYNLILILESDEIILQLGAETIESGFVVRFAGERTLVYMGCCPLANLQKLVAERKVIIIEPVPYDFDFHLPSLFGLFEYEHDSHALIPYERKHIPQYPLKLADLPEPLQLRLIEAGIDRIKFVESELVQPLEHTPCDAWGNTDYWIDTQGVEHTPESKLRNTWNPVTKTWIDEDGVAY